LHVISWTLLICHSSVDWNSDVAVPAPDPKPHPVQAPKKSAISPPKPAVQPAPSPTPAPVTQLTPTPRQDMNPSSEKVDEELEKRKARAARFGIPLVETRKSNSTPSKAAPTQRAVAVSHSTRFLNFDKYTPFRRMPKRRKPAWSDSEQVIRLLQLPRNRN
jgi:hypothetical protein